MRLDSGGSRDRGPLHVAPRSRPSGTGLARRIRPVLQRGCRSTAGRSSLVVVELPDIRADVIRVRQEATMQNSRSWLFPALVSWFMAWLPANAGAM